MSARASQPGSSTTRRALRRIGRHIRLQPAQLIVIAFASAIAVGTGLLALPFARADGGSASLLVALFTSTSAVCLTGLVVVDTPTYWSGFGEAVIMVLIQIGGFGILTLASLLALLLARRLGLRSRLLAQAETKALDLGDVRRVVRGVLLVSLLFETTAAIILTLRFWLTYGESFAHALYLGTFHAISAFNNAGFALFSTNLIPFATDPVVSLTIAAVVIAGGLGFPVLFELRRELLTPRLWSLHTKLVVYFSGLLILVGTIGVTAIEWNNEQTLGPFSTPQKLLVGFFHGVMPRTAGFNSVDYAEMDQATWLLTDVLMFIGGSPAGTAGGIKVTTFVLLGFVILAEVRGDRSVNVFARRLPVNVQRQALAVALLGAAAVIGPSLALLLLTDFTLDRVLFEVTSAFGTVGLSTGITADLPDAGQLLLIGLMFLGRLGPITLAAALALRHRERLYQFPEERPIVG